MFCNNFYNDYFGIYLQPKGMTSKKLNKFKNAFEFQNVFAMLCNEALHGRYGIENVPESSDERTILESLLWYGRVYFFKKDGNVLSLPGANASSFTLYRSPSQAYVWGANGYTQKIKLFIPNGENSSLVRMNSQRVTESKEGTGVMVRENELMYPFINYVIEFAEKITDTYRTLDVTRANIKRPYVVTAEESIIESVKSFFNKRDNNEEYIISSGIFPADKINILPFDQNPENIRDCTGLIDFYFSKFRELEAISSAPATIDKKAQISKDELHQNEGAQNAINASVANVLQRELDFCNEVLGTNMRVVSKMGKESENNGIDSERNEDTESGTGRESGDL
mgnify:FL=1